MTRTTDILTAQKQKQAVKPVLSPSAQTARLCQPDKQMELVLNNVIYAITSDCNRDKYEKILLDLMLSGGLRISEVLDNESFKVNVFGQVYIKGQKGSSSKLVSPIYYKNFWQSYKSGSLSPFYGISRFTFYKWLIKNEIKLAENVKGNNKVTHSLRHLHVYLMELMDIEESEISVILGHKSLRNVKYYLHGK